MIERKVVSQRKWLLTPDWNMKEKSFSRHAIRISTGNLTLQIMYHPRENASRFCFTYSETSPPQTLANIITITREIHHNEYPNAMYGVKIAIRSGALPNLGWNIDCYWLRQEEDTPELFSVFNGYARLKEAIFILRRRKVSQRTRNTHLHN